MSTRNVKILASIMTLGAVVILIVICSFLLGLNAELVLSPTIFGVLISMFLYILSFVCIVAIIVGIFIATGN